MTILEKIVIVIDIGLFILGVGLLGLITAVCLKYLGVF